jgi:hypothetical protein
MQMAAQGVNTASLGDADQGSGFRIQQTENAQHPKSNIQRPMQQADVRCSVFEVRGSMLKHYSITPSLHYPRLRDQHYPQGRPRFVLDK